MKSTRYLAAVVTTAIVITLYLLSRLISPQLVKADVLDIHRTYNSLQGTLATQVALAGQLIPAISSDYLQAKQSTRDWMAHTTPIPTFKIPIIEYHLYDIHGSEVKLSFNFTDEDSLNDLWRNWAGKWVIVTGQFSNEKILKVSTFKADLSRVHISTTQAIRSTSSSLRAQQVTVVGQLHTDFNNPALSMSPNREGFAFSFTDITGKVVGIYLFERSGGIARFILKAKSKNLIDMNGEWVKLTGWTLSDRSDVIYLQILEEIEQPELF